MVDHDRASSIRFDHSIFQRPERSLPSKVPGFLSSKVLPSFRTLEPRNSGTLEPYEAFSMHDDRDHVISVVLSHADWQEFVKLQPQPAAWLHERIQEILV